MRKFGFGMLALTLAACAPPVPDSGANVNYEVYRDPSGYRVARDTELSGGQPQQFPAPPASTLNTEVRSTEIRSTEVSNTDGRGSEVQASPNNPRPVEVEAPNTEAGSQRVVTTNNPRISDEQDFTAVADRESIESDRERLAAQRQAREVIAPSALPTRSGASGPNVVEYAINTRNAVGQKVYRRSPLSSTSRTQRNCAKYASADLAQEAFLSIGGPERDRLRLDPDGDGFACGWDPTPYRRLAASQG